MSWIPILLIFATKNAKTTIERFISCEQFQVEYVKKILLRVLSTQKGKITHIFLWTFTREKSEDGSIKLEKKRLLMSSSIQPYKEFGKEAETYVSPEDSDG